MTHTTLAVIAVATWAAGIGATGALAYTMRKPVAHPVQFVEQTPARLTFAQIYDRIPPPEPEPAVIVLPNVDIVGAAPVRARPAPTHEPRCTAWRPLQQGSNMVQTCE
jgi:hypothetical protein